MKEIVIYPNKRNLMMAGGGSLLFVGLSIYFIIYPYKITGEDALGRFFDAITPGLFYVSAPLFTLPLLYVCYRLVKPSPALIISDEGIFDNASAFSAGMIRWEEIKQIFIYKVMDARFLGIIPVDIEPILARHSTIKRFLVSKGNKFGSAPFAVPETILPMPLEELLATIESYRGSP